MLVKSDLDNCPRCCGRIIIDRRHPGEANCINCGHVVYFQEVSHVRRYKLVLDLESRALR